MPYPLGIGMYSGVSSHTPALLLTALSDQNWLLHVGEQFHELIADPPELYAAANTVACPRGSASLNR